MKLPKSMGWIILGAIGACFLIDVGVSFWRGPLRPDLGIRPHPSGQAVYLDGEACTINTTSAQTVDDVARLGVWCTEQHAAWKARTAPGGGR